MFNRIGQYPSLRQLPVEHYVDIVCSWTNLYNSVKQAIDNTLFMWARKYGDAPEFIIAGRLDIWVGAGRTMLCRVWGLSHLTLPQEVSLRSNASVLHHDKSQVSLTPRAGEGKCCACSHIPFTRLPFPAQH